MKSIGFIELILRMKNFNKMNKFFLSLVLLLQLAACSFAQNITFSEPIKDDTKDINFEIIGKMKGDILVFKNVKAKYAINIFDKDMQLKATTPLDFLPSSTFNVNFVAYADSIFLIYQYQKKNIVYCMAAKLDAGANIIGDPIQLDTTKIGWLGDNKIYSTINSDDKKQIMIFKIERKNDTYNFATLLFNNQFQLKHQSRLSLDFDRRVDLLSDFFVDNDGNFVFTRATKAGFHDNIDELSLFMKAPLADSFEVKNINLNNIYLDEVKFKIDNANKHYIINSFYYNKRSGNIEGLFCNIYDRQGDSNFVKAFIPLDDSLRAIATISGSRKIAFNNFLIRNIIVKKDGGYLLCAEDFYEQASGLGTNPWDRMSYLYGNPYAINPYSYYNYNPSYYWYYHPYSSYNQPMDYYYNNVMLLNINKNGKPDWGTVVLKQQYASNDDNYLSFLTFNTGGEIHFVFNEMQRRSTLVQDNTVSPDGAVTRNPPLKTMNIDYDFMPKFGRQVGAKEVIIPCTYRSTICFAKIDY